MNIKQTILGGVARGFGRQLRVEAVIQLSTNLRLVRFSAPSPNVVGWSPGDKIKLRLPSGVLRSYTPARWTAAGLDVIFFIHGHGPASHWAQNVRGGEKVFFMGPAKSVPAAEGQPPWALFLGDETAVGLAQALLEALPAGTRQLGAIELAAEDAGSLTALGLSLEPVTRLKTYGPALLAWLERTHLPKGDGVIWLSGEATSVLLLREALAERGYHRPQVRPKPYWSVQGHAHRKTIERQALAG